MKINLDTIKLRSLGVKSVHIKTRTNSITAIDSHGRVVDIHDNSINFPDLPLPGITGIDEATGYKTGQLSHPFSPGGFRKDFGVAPKATIREYRKRFKSFTEIASCMKYAILDYKHCNHKPVKENIPCTFGMYDIWHVKDYLVIVNSSTGEVWDVYLNGVSYMGTALVNVDK